MRHAWLYYGLEAVAAGVAAATLFIAVTYTLALFFTRGRFGWPGFFYFFRELLWVAVTQSLLPLGWVIRERMRAPSSGVAANGASPAETRPIVLVHGFTQNRTNFVWLARSLRRAGLGPFFGFNYFSFDPIDASARALGRFVEDVLETTGAREVDLVCHSLGGLVARTYVDLLGGDARVRRVVTLGTPHAGLGVHALPLLGASVRDMRKRSEFFARLNGAPPPPRGRYTSIYSSHDNVVFPAESASALGERGLDVPIRGYGHFGILFSPEVAEHVRRALLEDPGRDGHAPG